MKKPKRKPAPEALTDRLYKVAAKYLEANGWKPIVMGGTAIQQPLLGNKFNYEFVIRFTGKRINGPSGSD